MADIHGTKHGVFPWEWIARVATWMLLSVGLWLMTDINNTLKTMSERVNSIEVRLAGNYITRDEARVLTEAIEERVNRRIDREHPAIRR